MLIYKFENTIRELNQCIIYVNELEFHLRGVGTCTRSYSFGWNSKFDGNSLFEWHTDGAPFSISLEAELVI